MLALQIIVTDFPSLHSSDKISLARQLMEDYDVQHLPVLQDDKFAGLISKDDILDSSEMDLLSSLEEYFIHASVLAQEHFLSALKNFLSPQPIFSAGDK